MAEQRTFRKSVTIEGIGLHSGKSAAVTFKPALPNRGVVFVRSDLAKPIEIEATYEAVTNTQLATTLGRNGVTISTIEHVMAALQGMGIDNCVVEVNGPEIPILDGSSVDFAEKILEAGLEIQKQKRSYLRILRKVEVKMGEKWALIEPADQLQIHASIEFDHPAIGYQEYRYIDGVTDFMEIASARTFCFLRDVEAMKKAGLALGGSLENAVVLNEALVLNPQGLRFPDEFARHKVLDALGDFKLAGVALLGYVRMHRAGHDLHRQLLKAIFSDASNYEIVQEIQPARAAKKRPAVALVRSYAVG